jgi:hypothetical protein
VASSDSSRSRRSGAPAPAAAAAATASTTRPDYHSFASWEAFVDSLPGSPLDLPKGIEELKDYSAYLRRNGIAAPAIKGSAYGPADWQYQAYIRGVQSRIIKAIIDNRRS